MNGIYVNPVERPNSVVSSTKQTKRKRTLQLLIPRLVVAFEKLCKITTFFFLSVRIEKRVHTDRISRNTLANREGNRKIRTRRRVNHRTIRIKEKELIKSLFADNRENNKRQHKVGTRQRKPKLTRSLRS